MLIAVDAMGGDEAPRDPVVGAVDSARDDGNQVLLVGQEAVLRQELGRLTVSPAVAQRIELVDAEEVVGMDEPAITPIRRKRKASIRVCAELVRDGRAEAMVSAGNTGAAMICAKTVIGTSPGVDRPALAATLPNAKGWTILVDVGANVDAKAEQLRQFAVMGHFYAQKIVGVTSPRIGLLSIGEEEGKGNDSTKSAFKILESAGLNFVGNVEGGDVFNGEVDVVVCDGFVGNALLKSAEALAEMVRGMIRQELMKGVVSRLGAALAVPAFKRFGQRTDYSEYGGAPFLGIKGGCFVAHGRSNPKAIKNAIRRAVEFCEADIATHIAEKLAEVQQAADALAVSTEELQPS